MPIGAIISAVPGLISAGSALFGGNSVSKANNSAANVSGLEYLDIAGKLNPYLKTGTTASQVLGSNYFGVNQDGTYDPNAPYLQPISSVVGQAPGAPDYTTLGAPPSPNDASLQTSFQASPGYTFQRDQGNEAIQNSAAGKTGALSGNALKSMDTFTTGLAAGDWNNYYKNLQTNYYDRYNSLYNDFAAKNTSYTNSYNDIANNRGQVISGLSYLGGQGQNAAANLGGFGQAAATNIGNYGIAGAGAKAGGIQGAANSLGPAATSLGNLYNQYSGSGYGSNSGYGYQDPYTDYYSGYAGGAGMGGLY